MGNWDLNPTYRCYNPIHSWSEPILNALSRISHEHEWIFFQVLLRSLTKYKVDWDMWSLVLSCHVSTFMKLSFINYWQTWTNRHQQFQQKFTGIFTESPDILWQNLGPMTLISPPTWSWEASGFAPLVGRLGWKWPDESFPGSFLRQRWVGRTLLEATTLQWLNQRFVMLRGGREAFVLVISVWPTCSIAGLRLRICGFSSRLLWGHETILILLLELPSLKLTT